MFYGWKLFLSPRQKLFYKIQKKPLRKLGSRQGLKKAARTFIRLAQGLFQFVRKFGVIAIK
jgi:hypothetical protein